MTAAVHRHVIIIHGYSEMYKFELTYSKLASILHQKYRDFHSYPKCSVDIITKIINEQICLFCRLVYSSDDFKGAFVFSSFFVWC